MTSSATWEEIKRLAADFQRIQLVESTNKLSERNCIEIVNRLLTTGLLNAVFTLDGKEYVTDKQIVKEIYDELYVHEGRISMTELQRLLNIDISHVENKISEIAKNDSNLTFITGQIISKDYMNKISEEINDLLQEKGNLLVSDLSNQYELPIEFFTQMLRVRVGSIIKGQLSDKCLYTENYVQIQKVKIAGSLEATLKPIRLTVLVKELDLDASMSLNLLEELIATKQIEGTLFGGKHETAVFVPKIYVDAQKLYVESFYRQNGYIDFTSLKKIGITEPDQYSKSLLGDHNIQYYSSCCIGNYLLDQIESNIEESINTSGYCELSSILPSIVNDKDTQAMAKYFLKKFELMNLTQMCETFLIRKEFLKNLLESFKNEIETKALEELKNPRILFALKSNNIIIGDGNANSGGTSSAPVKGKGKSKVKAEQADDGIVEVKFINEKDLETKILNRNNDLSEDLLPTLVEYLIRPLNQQYLETLKAKYETGIPQGDIETTKAQSVKLTIKDLQEKLRSLVMNARVFDRALKTVSNQKLQDMLNKHLVKTICNDMVNELFKYVANEQGIAFNEENFNNDTRTKILPKVKSTHKQQLTELNQCLNTKTYSEIIEIVESATIEILEMQFKKFDQKKEREITLQLRESTKSALENENDPATILQLVSLLIYNRLFEVMINAPGRCVPLILESVKAGIKEEVYEKLASFQTKIIENLTKDKSSDVLLTSEMINEIKQIGLNPKDILKSKD